MVQSRIVVALSIVALIGLVTVGGGCQATVRKPSVVDLTALVQSVNERPELATTTTEGQKPITIVVTGAKSQETKLADWWSYLGEPKDKRSAVGDTFAAMGFGDRVVYTMDTKEPLGVYVEHAVTRLVQSKGFTPSAGAPRTLVVSLDKFWLDNTSSRVVRKANLGASVQVQDSQAQTNEYVRGVQVESSFSSDQSHIAVGWAGAAMASVVGIGPSGEGMRKKADAEAALAAIAEALKKFQDELASDPELWNAMR